MPARGALPALVLLVLLAACGERQDAHRNNTAVLGSSGPDASRPAPAFTLQDGQGQAIPPPPAPAQAHVEAVRAASDLALALWLQDGQVIASAWTRAAGWTQPQPLERIHGESTDPCLASNGQGRAMALWHHRVGNIHSLRYSPFDASGWGLPDVLPGALPRPNVSGRPGGPDAPRLQMDAQGNVTAQWTSGFHANETQVARYTVGGGWSRATGEPVASAPGASPANPVPSSAR